MGTNYYQRTDICKCCNRYKERHIGKSSCGWQFSFQGYMGYEDNPKIQSFKDWIREIKADIHSKIFDEYGRELSLDEFIKLVEDKKAESHNHYDYCKKEASNRGYDISNDWKDDEGYSFSSHDFS